MASFAIEMDKPARSHLDRWLCKEAKFKARKSRGVRRTDSTPQRQRDEAQRRNWAIYKAIEIYKRYPWVCQREVEPMGSTSTASPAHPVAYKIVTFAAIPTPSIGFRLTPPFF
jgi:hypothetical protein